ncbi:hypothetical protein FAM09_26785 [Niastella caeni]|uniref:Uncharacterized protein YyaB-like PH domain-containing protein n=1 Tax=Niastella caeni TaxID=2569763 RepID=A0A4S8HI30_9BACT|nr:PH domain-containing protein [Niastella caeni]THU32402.1 hypothetical protein FAM09_26785 [Niastella caeni]
MKKIYRSKPGLELIIPISLILGVVLFLTTMNEPHWVGPAILLPIIIFITHTFITTYYTIDNNLLIIKCGFLYKTTIDIQHIRKIKETNSTISSPATSIDRLEISYGKYRTVLISPKQKMEFINELKSLNPGIEINLKKSL